MSLGFRSLPHILPFQRQPREAHRGPTGCQAAGQILGRVWLCQRILIVACGFKSQVPGTPGMDGRPDAQRLYSLSRATWVGRGSQGSTPDPHQSPPDAEADQHAFMELLLNTQHVRSSHCVPSIYGAPAVYPAFMELLLCA